MLYVNLPNDYTYNGYSYKHGLAAMQLQTGCSVSPSPKTEPHRRSSSAMRPCCEPRSASRMRRSADSPFTLEDVVIASFSTKV